MPITFDVIKLTRIVFSAENIADRFAGIMENARMSVGSLSIGFP